MAKDAALARPKTRMERQEAMRQRLLEAAAAQVGAVGYAGASIQKIATAAKIANGTFYNYFDSQQDLFDQLLPELGKNLLRTIRKDISGETDSLRREELGFQTFFRYLAEHPAFYRVLNEAETFSPKAYADHMENMASGYLRALRQAANKGELNPFTERELEVIVHILLSARDYLAYRFVLRDGKVGRLPDWVTAAYMKFVMSGLLTSRLRRGGPRSKPDDRTADRYRLEPTGDGQSQVVMAVSDALLDDAGAIEHGAISGLVERAAVAACGSATARTRVASLSISFVRESHARTLVAAGRQVGLGLDTAHVTVSVNERDDTAEPIATGLVVVALGGDSLGRKSRSR